MHIALKVFEFWAIVFITLALSLVVLNIVWAAIDYDLALNNLSKELSIAAIAALVEGGSLAAMILLTGQFFAGGCSHAFHSSNHRWPYL